MTTAPDWLTLRLLGLGLAVVLASCLVLACLVVGTKTVRALRARRKERHVLPWRPQLLELAAGEGGEQAVASLDAIPAASWPTVQDFVLALLGKVKGEPARELVAVLTRHDAPQQARRDATARGRQRRGRAAIVLGRCGDPSDLPLLTGLLDDRDALVRQAAAVALGQLGEPEAAPALFAAARATNGLPGIPAGVAVDALLGLDFGIEDALVAGLRDPDPGVRSVAAEVVAGRASVLARSAVREALARETDPTVAAALCRALGAVGDDSDVAVLHTAVLDGPESGRRDASRALGSISSGSAVDVLAGLAEHDDPQLAGAAASTLAGMHHPTARPALQRAAARGSRAADEQLVVLQLRRSPRPALRSSGPGAPVTAAPAARSLEVQGA